MSTGPVVTTSRVYSDIIPTRPSSYWDYEQFKPEWGSAAPYQCCESIGKGKYSEVFRGINKYNNQPCVIKILKPVKKIKIQREISILQNLSGGKNVVQLLDLVREPVTNTYCLILEWCENQDFHTLYPSLKIDDVAYYLYKVLQALDVCHSQGIIHRDIKPHNIMIDPVSRKVRLIDWGLAEYYHPEKQYNVRVATRYFKSPELLVDYKYYDYALDLWSFGCLLAGIVFKKEPFFHGQTIDDQLVVITKVLGTEALLDYLKKYKIMLDPKYDNLLATFARRRWGSFVNSRNKHLCTDDVLDLLSKLLVYDHCERLTAKEAMDHKFFQKAKKKIEYEDSVRGSARV